MTLDQRYHDAIRRIGGTAGLLSLPDPVKDILKNAKDLEIKVKMMEMIADKLGR